MGFFLAQVIFFYTILDIYFDIFIMKILVFDTETTWFLNKKDPALSAQPSIIQFAGIIWELYEWKYKELDRKNILINPWYSIPFDASKVHHIYDIDVKEKPKMNDEIDTIMNFISEADILVGHNIEYDESMLLIELQRYQKQHLYHPDQVICTMKLSVDFCELQGNWERFKYPKLSELHKKLFWEYFSGAHDAMLDVEATLKCFLELEKLWVIVLQEQKQEVMSLF